MAGEPDWWRDGELQPTGSAQAGQWLLRADVDWWDLVRYGPPDFDVYVRIAFGRGPARDDGPGEDPTLRLALARLALFRLSRGMEAPRRRCRRLSWCTRSTGPTAQT